MQVLATPTALVYSHARRGSGEQPGASHISVPLRSSLHQTRFVRGRVTDVDFERRVIVLDGVGAVGGELN
jgi:NADH dehydrogenase FAD-containing subunit